MVCSKCKIPKSEDSFSFRNKRLNIRKKRCKECDKIYRKKYYQKNDNTAKKYAIDSNKKIRLRNQQFLWDYLLNHPCVDCGEDDPLVLEFDHQRDKEKTISKMVMNNYSIQKIEFEIQKCVVRCANCHRRKTAKDFGWYRNILKVL